MEGMKKKEKVQKLSGCKLFLRVAAQSSGPTLSFARAKHWPSF
jgi:hypothetical protein